jgi:nucleotide-binding universal stress UspA family protein
MSRRILVGFDPRSGDHAPVDFGIAAARFTGAPMTVACVQVASVEAGSPPLPLSVGAPLPYRLGQPDEDLLADCTDAVERIESEAGDWGIEVRFRKLSSTSAARALHALADEEDAGLLVVGSRHASAEGPALGGSTALRLMHGAPCPIAVVPAQWAADRILATIGVAFVDSEEGHAVLSGAYALASRAKARLRVITVVKASRALFAPKDLEAADAEHRARAERELREAVANLGDAVAVDVEVLVGDPAERLIGLSGELDLLVCGSRGYGPVRAVLLGSVSRRVTAEAHCPVIVVPRGVQRALEAIAAPVPGAAAPS